MKNNFDYLNSNNFDYYLAGPKIGPYTKLEYSQHSEEVYHPNDFSPFTRTRRTLTIKNSINRIDVPLDENYDCDIYIKNSRLFDLKGMPKVVYGSVTCSLAELHSLEGAPKYVSGTFDASSNFLSSYVGAPKNCQTLDLSSNPKLTTLKDIGNYFTFLEFIHIPHTVQSNILGLLRIQGLKSVATRFRPWESVSVGLSEAMSIVNKYLKEPDKDILECQEELIDAGLKQYAKL